MPPLWISFCNREIVTIIIWQGKSKRSDWFFLGRDFAIRTVSVETVISCVFLFSKAGNIKTSMLRVPYNKLLTNLASSSRTGEYWPLPWSQRLSFILSFLFWKFATRSAEGSAEPERKESLWSRSLRISLSCWLST